jgi:hypothetical protein
MAIALALAHTLVAFSLGCTVVARTVAVTGS